MKAPAPWIASLQHVAALWRGARARNTFLGRLYLLLILAACDAALLTLLPHAHGFLGPTAYKLLVGLAALWGFTYFKLKTLREPLPFRPRLLLLHYGCIAAYFLGYLIFARGLGLAGGLTASILLATPFLLGLLLLALACIPARAWLEALRMSWLSILYALLVGAAALYLRDPMQELWIAPGGTLVHTLQSLTYQCVWGLLHLLLPNLGGDPARFIIGAPQFLVFIDKECSGMEGLGLVLVFTVIWLWRFRKESRFPHALLLIPCALLAVWLLNVLRIAALVLIGAAGYPEVAVVGFHSQAGWIAFTLVALTFSMASQKIAWMRRSPEQDSTSLSPAPSESEREAEREAARREASHREAEATTAYLLPFLAIMGASFLSKSVSGYFEWLYPLRFVAAAAAIWMGRRELRRLDWRCGWLAPAVGVAIYALWVAPSWLAHATGPTVLQTALAALPPAGRALWLCFRVAAAVVTVPIAEELAFRGYLARRLSNRDFTAQPFTTLRLLPVLVSSVAFGLMHGQHWLAGIVAGLAYAGALRWKGRIGDAVVAHAVSNLLLAVSVLGFGDWSQW